MSDVTEGNDERPEDEVASAVDEKQHKRKESKIKRMQREDREFFRHMLSLEAGRRFAWSILNECHTFETRFGASPNGSPDSMATWMHAAEKDIGQRFYQLWHLKEPDGVMLMLRENDTRYQGIKV